MLNKLKMYSPGYLNSSLPLEKRERACIETFRSLAKSIVLEENSPIPLIMGPCSIHDIDSALTYGRELKKLQHEVKDTFFLIMRVYVEKPRTTVGWKGLAYDPLLNGTDDIKKGIYLSRKLFLDLASLDIPLAMEFVNPLIAPYLQDLITWGFIGARTASSQTHRELASSLPFPVGFKNTIEGNLELPIGAMIAAKVPHTFLHLDDSGHIALTESIGNPHTHLVLRGSCYGPNCDPLSIIEASSLQNKAHLDSKILIDCAHGNSHKKTHLQEEVFEEIIEELARGNPHILGLMLESHLEEGQQEACPSALKNISVTDPCIGWDKTRNLILKADQLLQKSSLSFS